MTLEEKSYNVFEQSYTSITRYLTISVSVAFVLLLFSILSKDTQTRNLIKENIALEKIFESSESDVENRVINEQGLTSQINERELTLYKYLTLRNENAIDESSDWINNLKLYTEREYLKRLLKSRTEVKEKTEISIPELGLSVKKQDFIPIGSFICITILIAIWLQIHRIKLILLNPIVSKNLDKQIIKLIIGIDPDPSKQAQISSQIVILSAGLVFPCLGMIFLFFFNDYHIQLWSSESFLYAPISSGIKLRAWVMLVACSGLVMVTFFLLAGLKSVYSAIVK